MKKSTIMLTGTALIILIIIISLIAFLRITADRFIVNANDPEKTVKETGIIKSKELDLQNFDSLIFNSSWNVKIKQAHNYKIILSTDQAFIDELTANQSGKRVVFSYDKFLRNRKHSKDKVKVEIHMPELISIRFNGFGQVELHDFDLKSLEIINSGASNIEAYNVFIENLDLKVNGAAQVELSNIKIKNCRLNVSGAANIELNMTGGRLTGRVSGAANVEYSGTVTEQSVKVSGIASIKEKN